MSTRPVRGGTDAARREAVRTLLDPAVTAAGLDLEDVEVRPVGRRLVVRVLVDSDSGVSLDEVASVSQVVSETLDAHDVLGDEPYTLEVSSPGVGRPLTEARHWRRNVGRLVSVTTTRGDTVVGRLTSFDQDAGAADLEVSEKGRTSTRALPVADVRRAVVEVEFNRPATDAEGGSPQPADDEQADDEQRED